MIRAAGGKAVANGASVAEWADAQAMVAQAVTEFGRLDAVINSAGILRDAGLPFIVQTTVGSHNVDELAAIAEFAHAELKASVWNLYFLVPTGRGAFVSDISPEQYDRVLADLATIQKRFSGKMLVNAKCAPHYVKTLLESDPGSPFLKTFTGGAGHCT